jgi:hypothetical protein
MLKKAVAATRAHAIPSAARHQHPVKPVVMDSLVAASSRALAAGDTLGALKRVAMRNDPPALALRGIAMALGMLDNFISTNIL